MSMNVGDVLRRAASLSPQSVAATLDHESVTFSDAHRRANRTAHGLAKLGLRRGDRVASWTDISLRAVDVFFGVARLGGAYAPINPSLSPGETMAVAAYLQPRALIVDDDHVTPGEEMARQLDVPLLIVGALSERGPLPGVNFDAATADAAVDDVGGLEPASDSTHVIFLTSGSTGQPKGVMLSHYATWMRSVPTGGATRLHPSGGGGEVCMFPLFHMAGWNSLMCSWSLLRPVHFVPRADGDLLLSEVARWQASTLYCIPAVWQRALASSGEHDLSSLRYALTGTSLVSQELLHQIKERLPWTETTVSYGSTEMGVVSSLGNFDLFRKPQSIGLPNPGFDAALIDGELCLRGETVMSGYFELPTETAAAFTDGWYRSGDLAEMDDEGYLTITGRRSEIIRSGGETIAPSEVEAAIEHYPGIQEVAVVGLPDASWGELVCAVVVPRPDVVAPTVDELRRYLAPRLASFKHPRVVTCVASIPRTAATGQIQRAQVRQSILDRRAR
jgi:acyl-CoA synthetase (AMP-forming)/AMP-acid ligase II